MIELHLVALIKTVWQQAGNLHGPIEMIYRSLLLPHWQTNSINYFKPRVVLFTLKTKIYSKDIKYLCCVIWSTVNTEEMLIHLLILQWPIYTPPKEDERTLESVSEPSLRALVSTCFCRLNMFTQCLSDRGMPEN